MTRREWRDLGLVLALALTLRIALWWVLPRESLVSDEQEYLAATAWLAQGRGFSFYAEWPWLRPPAYLLFLAPSVRLFGLSLAPIRLTQIALSLLVPVLAYLLARAMFGRRVGLLAGLLTAFWLPLAILPHLVLAENLFLPLLLAAMYCLARFQQEPRPGWSLAAGGLLGLATLTRGLTLGFLPLVVLWMWVRVGPRRGWRALISPALLAATAALVILPWTGYTSLRYGRLILVDTTGGYNFWLGTQGGQFSNLREVHQSLLELPDPAARQSYAYLQGLGAIAADPIGFLSDRTTEIGQLLRINYGADERLVDGFVLGAVSVPHLLGLLLLEDTLYVLLVPLALMGVFRRKGEPGRGPILLWLGYNLLLAVAFFAIGRFRLPLLPFLAIYAGAALEGFPWLPLRRRDQNRPSVSGEKRAGRMLRWGAVLLLISAFWVVVLPSYLGPYPASLGATLLGLQGRWAAGHLARAEAAISAGELDLAGKELDRALTYRPDGVRPIATALVIQAELKRAGGDETGALESLDGQNWYQAILLRGDILRAQGDLEEARSAFRTREIAERNPTAWAWTHLVPPADGEVDIGGGLDWGLVDGFYQPEHDGETSYRWSGEQARLRFPQAGTGQPQALYLHLRGWRPSGEAPAAVHVLLEEIEVARFTAPAEWQQVRIDLPQVPLGEDVIVTLRVTPFLAGPRDLLETGKLRALGLMVDWAGVR